MPRRVGPPVSVADTAAVRFRLLEAVAGHVEGPEPVAVGRVLLTRRNPLRFLTGTAGGGL